VITLEQVVRTFIYLLVAGAIFWLLFWLVNYIAPPEPFNKFIRVFLAVCGVLVIISILLSLAGYPLIRM
jgi:hypothetical protein